jgi:hypothetical protein
MRIQAYRALHAEDVPPLLFAELDTLNEHLLAAFEHYPDSGKIAVAAWATTGEISGELIGALVARARTHHHWLHRQLAARRPRV